MTTPSPAPQGAPEPEFRPWACIEHGEDYDCDCQCCVIALDLTIDACDERDRKAREKEDAR